MTDYLKSLAERRAFLFALAFGTGIGLLLIDGVLSVTRTLLPGYTQFVDETLYLLVIAVLGTSGWYFARAFGVVLVAIAVSMGYWILPNMGSTVVYFATVDHTTGVLERQYLDETEKSGARNIFVIRDATTGTVESYVAQDEIILALGFIPLVYQDDSQVTRDKLVSLVGKCITVKDVHDRYTKREMPVLGVFGGTITAFFGADWTSFPNIIRVEEAQGQCGA